MKPISYARHRFPPDVMRHAVWFTLNYRDVEEALSRYRMKNTKDLRLIFSSDRSAIVSQFEACAVRTRLRMFENETVWEGVVLVFDILRYPKPSRAYAWSSSAGEAAIFRRAY
jgi:hypothetical protein